MRPSRYLLVFVPIALAADFWHWSPIAVFAASALAVIPLAALLGEATELLAEKIGPRYGGLLNATFGNAAELIITMVAIRAGMLELVRASLIGSVLGNILLVLGFSIFLGGLRHGIQRFDRASAGQDATLLVLVAIGIGVPSLFSAAIEPDTARVEELSLSVAAVLLLLYVLSLLYTLRTTPATGSGDSRHARGVAVTWAPRTALMVLAAAVVAIAVMSKLLVGAVEPVTTALGWSQFFVGIIIVPFIGNVAEHVVAVQAALRNQMDLSLSIATGSSLQIALFVAPVLVFVSLAMGHPLTLEFNGFELIALVASAGIAAFISADGRSNWLEGVMLLAVYLVLALAFFFLPSTF